MCIWNSTLPSLRPREMADSVESLMSIPNPLF